MKSSAVLLCGCCLVASSARAQSPDDRAPGRFEIAGGPTWFGGTALGTMDATETGPDGGRVRLFTTSTRLERITGTEGRVAVRVPGGAQVEGAVSYARPRLETRAGADLENAESVTAAEPLQQWTIEGAFVLNLIRWRLGSRVVPFVRAGAGYLRQLHEGRAILTTGRLYDGGGGISFILRSRPDARLKGAGVRLDVRAVARTGGVAFDGRAHIAPDLGLSLFARF